MSERIPVSSQSWEHTLLRDEILRVVDEVIEADDFSEYGIVRELEEEFAGYLGVPDAVAVNSGTSAIFLGLRAAGIGPGDEVIIAPNTCHSVTSGLQHAGASFRFADVNPGTFNLDPDKVSQAVTDRTRAIFAVHMYGHPADMDSLLELAAQHDLLLIEDAALATGARYRGRPVGGIAPMGIFSFGPHKVATAIGGAGMVAVHDRAVADKMRLLRSYGVALDFDEAGNVVNGITLRHDMDHVSVAYNVKMDAIQAAVVRLKLAKFEDWMRHRQAMAERYREGLEGLPVDFPLQAPDVEHAYKLYTICLDDRDRLRRHLAERNIETGILYYPPLHMQTVYKNLGYEEGDFPVSEDRCARLLNLPMYNGIGWEQVDRVIEAIREFFG